MKICRKFALGSPLIPLENSIFNFDVRKSTEFSILKGKGLSNGFFFEPTLFTEVSPKNADRKGRNFWTRSEYHCL